MDTTRIILIITISLIAIASAKKDKEAHNSVQHSPVRTATCLYNNETYQAGQKFRPDDCTFCHCPHHGGRARCAVQDCQFLQSCVHYEKAEGECCGRCAAHGCLHSDGKVYPPRSVVLSGNCDRCICPPGGGRVVCARARCPPALCVDAVKRPGECCYSCPNGPNCLLSDHVIPAGKPIHTSKCQVCECPSSISLFGRNSGPPQAVCSISNEKDCNAN